MQCPHDDNFVIDPWTSETDITDTLVPYVQLVFTTK
jgi:hypothetical protein